MALDLLVSHPGNPRVYDMVAALRRAGFTVYFATGYYFDAQGPETRLPGRFQARLRRRLHPEIDLTVATRSLVGEALAVGTRPFAPLRHRVANAWFDRRAARLVRRLRPRAVLAAESCALYAFRAAAPQGAMRILDQVIGFEGEGARVLGEEVARHPELASTTDIPNVATVARCRAEALEADRILAPSAYVRDTMTAIGVDPSRIALVPYGTDVARFSPPAQPRRGGPFRVLFAGQIGARKGVMYLLDGFQAAALPDAELVLAGPVLGDPAWLGRHAARFRHVTQVAHAEVHRLYQEADVYAFPSLHEGSSVSILEAMACGLPVVTTPNAGSLVTDGVEGFIVPIRDPAALADRLRRLHADPALRARMGAAARATALAHGLARYEADLAREVGAVLAAAAVRR
jgi:glycosyltransferase involved in cell wall biosynthesis